MNLLTWRAVLTSLTTVLFSGMRATLDSLTDYANEIYQTQFQP